MHYDMGMSSTFIIESPQSTEAYFGERLLAIKKEVIKLPSPPKKEYFPLSHLLSPAVLIEFQICPGPDR